MISIATIIVLIYRRHKLSYPKNVTTIIFVSVYIYTYIVGGGGAHAQGFVGRNRIRIPRHFYCNFNNIVPWKRKNFTGLVKTKFDSTYFANAYVSCFFLSLFIVCLSLVTTLIYCRCKFVVYQGNLTETTKESLLCIL
jgi:hypothetical protein